MTNWLTRQIARFRVWMVEEDPTHGTGEWFTSSSGGDLSDRALAERDTWLRAFEYAEKYAVACEKAGNIDTSKAIRSIAQTFWEQAGSPLVLVFHTDKCFTLSGDRMREALKAVGTDYDTYPPPMPDAYDERR